MTFFFPEMKLFLGIVLGLVAVVVAEEACYNTAESACSGSPAGDGKNLGKKNFCVFSLFVYLGCVVFLILCG